MAYLVFEHAEEFSRNIGPLVRDFVAPHALFPNMLLSLVMAVAGAILTPLYDTRMLKEEGPGRVFSGGSCWADLPMHMTVAESFINGRNQDVSWSQMVSPIFAGACAVAGALWAARLPPPLTPRAPPPRTHTRFTPRHAPPPSQATPWPTPSCPTSTLLSW